MMDEMDGLCMVCMNSGMIELSVLAPKITNPEPATSFTSFNN